jgi:hypothetical protein
VVEHATGGCEREWDILPTLAATLAWLDLAKMDYCACLHYQREESSVTLKPVTVDINYVVCKGNNIDSETLGHHIQSHGRTAGYDVTVNIVGTGGDHHNPIAKIHASGKSDEETTRSIDDIQEIALDGFKHLIDHAKTKSKTD